MTKPGAIDPSIIDDNAEKFVDVIRYLNTITRLLETHQISDGLSLARCHDDFYDDFNSICYSAIQSYDKIFTCSLIGQRNYKTPRAELAHCQSTLKKKDTAGGFDTITKEHLWEKHFSKNGHLKEIQKKINTAITREPRLEKKIHDITAIGVKPPIELLTETDFSHLKVFNNIKLSIQTHLLNIAGLLALLSATGEPPLKSELLSLVEKIFRIDKENFDFSISQLVMNGVLRLSISGNYIFIDDTQFANNVTRDFIEQNDMERIIEILESSDE